MSRILSVCLNPTFQRTVRLPRLDVGEVNRSDEARVDACGKGVNVSRVLRQLGGDVRHLTHLGPGREEFLRLCDIDGIPVTWVESRSTIRTCITLLDTEVNSTTEVIEPTEPVEDSCGTALNAAFDDEVRQSDWVILSGSKAPGYPPNLFAEFCRIAREAGTRVVADYRGAELAASLVHRPALVKINLVEFAATFLPNLTVSEADDAAALPKVVEKLEQLSADGMDIVLTRGAREVYCARGGAISTVAPPEVTPVNTIGSGDAVAAGMTFALAGGADLVAAAAEGVRCGARNAEVFRPGSLID